LALVHVRLLLQGVQHFEAHLFLQAGDAGRVGGDGG